MCNQVSQSQSTSPHRRDFRGHTRIFDTIPKGRRIPSAVIGRWRLVPVLCWNTAEASSNHAKGQKVRAGFPNTF